MLNEDSRIVLPATPQQMRDDDVAAWFEPVNIDTYDVLPPSPYPAYLDRRVYQGSSGRVYPMPFIEQIADEKHPQLWDAVHLENEYVRLMILPSLGGRIHHATDKTTGYDFFYKNNVMKPALVGVLGPWISGGVEFNWPQHHRPATYLPTSWEIERHSDGAITVWCSDHDPFARMKGTHGITLRPGSAVIELSARLTNRTDDVQTFLWWANVAAEVHDDYQAFFPTDMRVVADHAKRAITGYPNATVPYYGIDYPSRVDKEHPDADRIDWYRNIPVPTSYMCLDTKDDFFGGYDHREQAGFVYWADRHVAPGKKMWTWGNSDFGHAWDQNLTDTEGPYIELMAGAFTDNQPDFSFLLPGETKTFKQFWYPIQEVGVVHQANLAAAIHLDWADQAQNLLQVGVAVTAPHASTRVLLSRHGQQLWEWEGPIAPGAPLSTTMSVPEGSALDELELSVFADDSLLLKWQPRPQNTDQELPPLAVAAPMPDEVETNEELYLAGAHLEQYRHPTRGADQYFEEALRRDPHDVRSCVSLATRKWRRGQLEDARELLNRALKRLTFRNPNPYDSEAYYRLGLVLRDLGEIDSALAAFRKAAWDSRWKVTALLQAARLELLVGKPELALGEMDECQRVDANNQQAAVLRALAQKRLGEPWQTELQNRASSDRMNWWVQDMLGTKLQIDPQTLIDVALEYMSCGEYDAAQRLCLQAIDEEKTRPVLGTPAATTLSYYYLAFCEQQLVGDRVSEYLHGARNSQTTWAFPGRREDARVLAWAAEVDPQDAVARRLWGHWLYGVDRHQDAFDKWTEAVAIDDTDSVSRRNLGVAAVNLKGDLSAAVVHFDRALELAPGDAKLWQERDQLAFLAGEEVGQRLSRLENVEDQIGQRDDLTIAYVELLTLEGHPEKALAIMKDRLFHPWEGGEGKALRAWENANLALARKALKSGDGQQAQSYVEAAWNSPKNLGEARHPLANLAELHFTLGQALELQNEHENAQDHWRAAAQQDGDFLNMAVSQFSTKTLFQALALLHLGEDDQAEQLLVSVADYADELAQTPGAIEYFATSLPTMLLFHTDLDQDNRLEAAKLKAWASFLLGDTTEAHRQLTLLMETVPSDPEVVFISREVENGVLAR